MARNPHHLLNLPEILFQVAPYLRAEDIIACSLVCKSFHVSFTPYLWTNILLEDFTPSESRIYRRQDPFARFISLKPLVLQDEHRGERFLQALQTIAPQVRSLSIMAHRSPQQLVTLRNQCTRIKTLLIASAPFNSSFDKTYWDQCEALLTQNSTSLQSLTLVNWGKRLGQSAPVDLQSGHPLWTPLVTCSQHTNLTSLAVRAGMIHSRDLEAFWNVCQQLEILELTEMEIMVPWFGSLPGTMSNSARRFPKLRELTLARLYMTPERQLDEFILHCPILRTLVWRLRSSDVFPVHRFSSSFAAQAWPHLDSMEITGHQNRLTERQHTLILQSTRRPFRRLDLDYKWIQFYEFSLLRNHFKALTKVRLILSPPTRSQRGGSWPLATKALEFSKWAQDVLESCPSLEHFAATTITAKDIINGKPWACYRLRIFEAMINMNFSSPSRKPSGPRLAFSQDEESQCLHIFERLGQLNQLTELNLGCPDKYLDDMGGIQVRLLPLELRVGLGHLSTLRDLELIGYSFTQDLRMVDVEWMLQHWKNLRKIAGQSLAVKQSKTFGGKSARLALIVQALRAQSVEMPTLWVTSESELKRFMQEKSFESLYDTESEGEMDDAE